MTICVYKGSELLQRGSELYVGHPLIMHMCVPTCVRVSLSIFIISYYDVLSFRAT